MARGVRLSVVGAQPHVPPGTWGGYGRWCEAEGVNPYRPETMTPEQRERYTQQAGSPPPPRNPYRLDPTTPRRLGRPAQKDTLPWLASPGATVTEQCLAWLKSEFGGAR